VTIQRAQIPSQFIIEIEHTLLWCPIRAISGNRYPRYKISSAVYFGHYDEPLTLGSD
jgi:hypothetical protein